MPNNYSMAPGMGQGSTGHLMTNPDSIAAAQNQAAKLAADKEAADRKAAEGLARVDAFKAKMAGTNRPETSSIDSPEAQAALKAGADAKAVADQKAAEQKAAERDAWLPKMGVDANTPEVDPSKENIGPGASMTRGQADAINASATQALTWWNKLGTAGEIVEIQKLVGAKPDGKLGPQTLAKIYIKLGGEYAEALSKSNFQSGKAGVYTPIQESINSMKSLMERMTKTGGNKGSILL